MINICIASYRRGACVNDFINRMSQGSPVKFKDIFLDQFKGESFIKKNISPLFKMLQPLFEVVAIKQHHSYPRSAFC